MSVSRDLRADAIVLTLGTVALGIAVLWIAAGAGIPEPSAHVVRTDPMGRLLAHLGASGLGSIAKVLAWTIAGEVTVAAGLAVLLQWRGGQDDATQRLARALALAAASFALLLLLLPLPPYATWPGRGTLVAPLLPLQSWPGQLHVAAVAAVAFALLAEASRQFVRFWSAYPAPIEAEALGVFLRDRIAQPQLGFIAQRVVKALDGVERAAGKFFYPGAPLSDATDPQDPAAARNADAAQAAVQRASELVDAGGGAGATSRRLAMLGAGAAAAWWLSSLVPGPLTQIRLPYVLAILALHGLALVLGYAGAAAADLVAFQQSVGTVADRRRLDGLRAAGAFARFAIEDVPWIVMFAGTLLLFVAPGLIPDLFELYVVAVFAAFFAVAPGALALALLASILAHGLVDPRLALKRATLWTLLGLVVTFVFVLIERFVAMKATGWLGLPAETGAIVAGAAVAVSFVPLRRAAERWVERFVERRMPTHLIAFGDRHEGAVAVTDITGFTALSARDEQAALVAVALLQKEARRLAEGHGGRVVKFTGDGAMLAFDDAGACATALREMHAAFAAGAATLSLPSLALHSGAHWGEYVAIRDVDVFGHTVNLASRLAEAAVSGEILVTAAFAQHLPALVPPPQPAGTRAFKNVPAPVECLRLG